MSGENVALVCGKKEAQISVFAFIYLYNTSTIYTTIIIYISTNVCVGAWPTGDNCQSLESFSAHYFAECQCETSHVCHNHSNNSNETEIEMEWNGIKIAGKIRRRKNLKKYTSTNAEDRSNNLSSATLWMHEWASFAEARFHLTVALKCHEM